MAGNIIEFNRYLGKVEFHNKADYAKHGIAGVCSLDSM